MSSTATFQVSGLNIPPQVPINANFVNSLFHENMYRFHYSPNMLCIPNLLGYFHMNCSAPSQKNGENSPTLQTSCASYPRSSSWETMQHRIPIHPGIRCSITRATCNLFNLSYLFAWFECTQHYKGDRAVFTSIFFNMQATNARRVILLFLVLYKVCLSDPPATCYLLLWIHILPPWDKY